LFDRTTFKNGGGTDDQGYQIGKARRIASRGAGGGSGGCGGNGHGIKGSVEGREV
jgi:hypothetical protein